MWERNVIKKRGKAAFKANYWACVLVTAIIIAVALGGYGISSLVIPSAGNTSMDVSLMPVSAKKADSYTDNSEKVTSFEDVDWENFDWDSIDPDEIDLTGIDIPEIIENLDDDVKDKILDEVIGTVKEEINLSALIPIAIAILSLLLLAAIMAFIIKLFILNPLQVAGYRFFRENALQRSSAMALDFNNKYKNIVCGMFLRNIFIFLWSLLFVIPGIVKSYSYRMVPFILTDNPGIKATDAITLSRQMMKGNKWKTFVLDLSFLGWYILSVLTLGILSIFYVNPYVYATEAELYHAIKRAQPFANSIPKA